MKRKLIIVGSILFLITIILLIVTKRPQQLDRGVAYVTPAPIQPSVFPRSLSDKSILYTGEPQFEFPQHVPYITITGRRSFEQESARLFSLNNIAGAPQIINGSRGKTALFSQNDREGIVSESPLSFAFTLASYSGSVVSGDTSLYQKRAVETLNEWSLLSAPYGVALSYVRYFQLDGPHPEEQSVPNGAVIAQIDLNATISGFPIFYGDANTAAFSVSFDGGNGLVKIRGFILPSVENTQREVSVVSYQDALRRLKGGAGILSSISLSAASGDVFMTGEIPTSIAVAKVTLGYLYAPLQEYLVPVFVFTGNARAPESNQILITTTVVSAL